MHFNIEIIFSLTLLIAYCSRHTTITYISLICLIASFYPQLLIPQLTDKTALMALSSAARGSLALLLPLLLIRRSPGLLSLAIAVTLLDCLYIIGNFLLSGATIGNYGIMLVSTMDACLIAIMYPFILKEFNLPIKIIPIIAILITTSSTGLGGIVIALLSISFLKYKPSFKLLLIPVLLLATSLLINPLLLSDSARFICWRWSMDWWWNNANIFFGTGYGTFSQIGPMIQVMTGQQIGNWYTMMHNDWLQLLFETGIIGFLLVCYSYYRLLKISMDRPYLFASVLVYGATAFIAMPMHYPLTMIIGALLIRECYYGK